MTAVKVKAILRDAAAALPAPWRFGRRYLATRRFLEATEREAPAARQAHVDEALAGVLALARDGTEHWGAMGLPGAIRAAEARAVLARLPFLEKEAMRDALARYTRRDVPASGREYLTTGGSSGIPFGFFHAPGDSHDERAFIHGVWGQLGWTPGTPTAVFRGAFVPGSGTLWAYDRYGAELRFSGYHLTAEHVPAMFAEVERRGITYLQCYPSAAMLLARLITSGAARAPRGLRGVFLGSETVLPFQRELVERAFGVPAVVWYGHAEAAGFAYECERRAGYHVDERYGIVELVDAAGRVRTDDGAEGELVVTGLRRRVTLFLRYRTGDLATLGPDAPCGCGRPGRRLTAIHGRVQEFVVSRAGRPVSATAINMHNDLFDDVLRFQFRQEVLGRVELLLMPGPGFTETRRRRISDEIGEKLGDGFELVVRTVDEVPLSPRGKQRFIDQRLPADQLPALS